MPTFTKAYVGWTNFMCGVTGGFTGYYMYQAFRNRAVRDSTLYRPVTLLALTGVVVL